MNQAQRILDILTLLQRGKELSISLLADRYETDRRTIQRDMKLLKERLGDRLICPKRGYYQLDAHSNLFDFLKENVDMRSFFEFIALFDEKQLSIFDVEEFPIIKEIKKDVKQCYHISQRPIESLDTKHLPLIKEAISSRRRISLTHTDRDNITRNYKDLKPIKIIFAQGNWYLGAITEDEQNGGFRFLRINFIDEFTLHPQTFHRDIEAETFIQNFQSLFQDYKTPLYEVTILIDSYVARYFKVKVHLKSQKIIEEKPNGDLLVSYMINNEMEILPIIKQWLPHIRILSPKSLIDALQRDIQEYLSLQR